MIPPHTYFDKVQKLLRKYDILFVADEIICGFGRTGNMFGSQTFNLRPDMISLAKPLSASYMPISALMINNKIYEAMVRQSEKLGTFGHGLTFGGHPVAAAVALEVLKIYEERRIIERVRGLVSRFLQGLKELSRHPLVGDARGVGFIGGLELVKNKATREPFSPSDGVTAFVARCARAHGVLMRWGTTTMNLAPPLIIEKDEIHEMFSRIAATLDDAYASLLQRRLCVA